MPLNAARMRDLLGTLVLRPLAGHPRDGLSSPDPGCRA
jgi:hypothetical protein